MPIDPGQFSLLVFDDSDLAHAAGLLLAPLTDLRASFDIRTGALTTLERIESASPGLRAALRVPNALVNLSRERHKGRTINDGSSFQTGSVLVINGRFPTIDTDRLASWSSLGVGKGEIAADGTVIAARIAPTDAAGFAQTGKLPAIDAQPADGHSVGVITRPWHVRTFRDACLAIDLALLTRDVSAAATPTNNVPSGIPTPFGWTVGSHIVRIPPTATVFPGVILDTSAGPIVIAEYAVIRPGAVLSGPCYVGEHSTIMDRAVIRGNTAIGPWCKVGGEVGGCIFQGYSNKGHDGYLGDSYVGEWVNLGANTTNSNLLNTYGEIVSRPLKTPTGPAGSNERTGEQFFGCVLGDHVKTAICTRVMTGAIVGTGTMFAASQPLTGTVPGFRWITDATPLSTTSAGADYRFDKFMDVARAAMGRRKIEPSPAYIERLRAITGG